jgi:hypothetical protein
MTSYFSQIQYVPDPITGERVNIGIVVIDSNGCQFQFVQDWRRPSQFGGEDVGFLREFAEEASRDGSGWFVAAGAAPSESLSHALSRWHNKIQFSPPMPSIKNRNDLINELAPRILHLSAEIETEDAARHKGRGREKAISTAVRSLGNAMREKFGRAPRGLAVWHVLQEHWRLLLVTPTRF